MFIKLKEVKNVEKKVWATPSLVILQRGTQQENVLEICYDRSNCEDTGPYGRAGCGHPNCDSQPACAGVTPT